MNKKDLLIDTLGLGFCLWLAGYLASFVLFFALPVFGLPKDMLGWVLFAVFVPVTLVVTFIRFHKRPLTLAYYATTFLIPILIGLRYAKKASK